MAKTFATLIDEIERKLEDSGNAIWPAANLGADLEDAFREISEYRPYVRRVSFSIESRTGTATTDTSTALVDTTETQFLSTDALVAGTTGMSKVVHNKTNDNWAVATAYVSTSQLTLSWDAFPDGNEDYEMFNKGCTSRFQINMEDVTDWVGPADHGVIAVEYPKGQRRNFTIEGDILTVDVNVVSDSKVVEPATATEVLVWFETLQRVSQLADLAGTVNGTVLAGATTFTIAAVGSGTDVIAEDTLFTFYLSTVRGTYKIKYDLTLSSGGGAIVFWPGLESAPADGAIVLFTGSTLNAELERLVVELTAARAAMNKSIDYIDTVNTGGAVVWQDFSSWGERKLGIVLSKLERLKNRQAPRTSQTYSRD